MHGTEEARIDGKVKVRIIHGLTLVIKNSYTCCKSFISPRSKVLLCMLLGGRLVGVNHRAPPTSTQGKTLKEYLMFQICYTTFTIRACYGICKLQHKYFSNSQLLTSITLISPSSYIKTIIKYQTSHSIQCTLYESFYYS